MSKRSHRRARKRAAANRQVATERLTAEEWETRVRKAEYQLLEAQRYFWDNLIDPDDAFTDDDGERWQVLGDRAGSEGGVGAWLDSEDKLKNARSECRNLALTNEFAINGHENRINYIVGNGHTYTAEAKHGEEVEEETLVAVQKIIDDFIEETTWHKRQQEIVRRKDRDGECFLRFFNDEEGQVRIRFVEPGEVSTPAVVAGERNHSFGIHTDEEDVETIIGYWIDEREIPAEHIQHRKANVDSNVKRGVPLFYAVRKNLRRAEKLQRNMSVAAGIQTAIAMLRKHGQGTKSSIEAAVQDRADVQVRNQTTGKTSYHRNYGPGSVLDVPLGTEYEFPAEGLDASRYVAVKQSELRAIASRLVMPEFMLTSDASNANYSSTMVAEGPAVKHFERLQWDMIIEDRQVMDRVLDAAVEAGRIPADVRERIEIQAEPPNVQTRDRFKEAQADEILVRNKAMSTHTMAIRHGLDPADEAEHIADDDEKKRQRFDAMAGLGDGGFGEKKSNDGKREAECNAKSQ